MSAQNAETRAAEDLLYSAWCLVANAMDNPPSEAWREAAVRWRDQWHAYIDAHIGDELPPCPHRPEDVAWINDGHLQCMECGAHIDGDAP